MKVLYFHQYFSTPQGAAGTRSYEMARRLVESGHQVLMVCGSAHRSQSGLEGPFVQNRRRGFIDGIEVLELRIAYSNSDGFLRRTIAFLRFAMASAKVALTEPCDMVFATTTPLTAGIPGVVARWCRGKPFVFEVRDLWPELPRAMGVISNPLVLWAMGVLEWVSYRSANRLVGLAPGIVEGIARRGVDRGRIAMIPNGCDIGIFSGHDGWRPAGVAKTDLMAVFAGAHGLANGLDAVLDAAAVLKRMGRDDIKIVLIGDGLLKPALVQRAATENLSNVVFHEPVGKTQLAGLMSSTDIGLQILANVPAFYYGTSPNKFFDYIASGLPVLINYPGWLADVVRENRCGFAVPPDDPDAFALALIDAADRRAELPLQGKRARKLAEGRFNRAVLSAQFVEWLAGPDPTQALRSRPSKSLGPKSETV
jgi:glycosyltransferase involved in cell wall biosynthesis